MRQLQLQSGEKAADRIESGADLVPGRLDGRDNRSLDPIPDGSGGALDSVEQVGSRVLHGFKRGGNLALDPIHDRADCRFNPVPDGGGGGLYGSEHRGNHCFHGIDLCGDDGNDAVPDAGEKGNDPVPDSLKERLDACPHILPCGAKPTENDLCQRLQQIQCRVEQAGDGFPYAGENLLHAVPQLTPVSSKKADEYIQQPGDHIEYGAENC